MFNGKGPYLRIQLAFIFLPDPLKHELDKKHLQPARHHGLFHHVGVEHRVVHGTRGSFLVQFVPRVAHGKGKPQVLHGIWDCYTKRVSPVLGDVLDVYWTMYGQQGGVIGLNSRSNRSE